MSKEFKCRIEAELKQPIVKTEKGLIDCRMTTMFEMKCSQEDYFYFCLSVVGKMIAEAEVFRKELKAAIATLCLMPEEIGPVAREGTTIDLSHFPRK